MLIEYWSRYHSGGVHPADASFLNYGNSIRLKWPINQRRIKWFEDNASLNGLLHINLTPQPFVGNIETASVIVLMANPGLSLSDYKDDFGNPEHMQASLENLRNTSTGFYPLLPPSAGTGAARYWRSQFKSLEIALADRLGIKESAARQFVAENVAVIEAGPYHSKEFPGDWSDRLPSSRMARRFVRLVLLPKAQRGEAVVLVLRRAAFWRIPSTAPGIIFRPARKAQLRYFLASETASMLQVLMRKHNELAASFSKLKGNLTV